MNDRKFLPWSREADKLAAIIVGAISIIGSNILAGTGYYRVDKFGRSDFDREMVYRDKYIEYQLDAVRDYVRGYVAESGKELEASFERRLDIDERALDTLKHSVETCQHNFTTLHATVHNFQNRFKTIPGVP